MPNWVSNNLVVKGNTEKVDLFLSKIVNEKGEFDFNCLIPQPELTLRCPINEDIVRAANNYVNAKAKTLEEARKYLEEFEERYHELTYNENWKDRTVEIRFPVTDWYEWNTANWGTKWNACHQEIKTSKSGDSAVLTITFDTAWSPPGPIIEKIFDLADQFNLEVEYYFREETEFHTTAYFNKNWYVLLDYDSLIELIETGFSTIHKSDTLSEDQVVEKITEYVLKKIRELIHEYKDTVSVAYVDQHNNIEPLDPDKITDTIRREVTEALTRISLQAL